jgi:hypothetical protein
MPLQHNMVGRRPAEGRAKLFATANHGGTTSGDPAATGKSGATGSAGMPDNAA